jgi:hypothetical protein
MAPYSLRVLPQMAMSRYMGNRETSNQTKMKNRSRLMNRPKTPATSRNMRAKNSLTRSSSSQQVSTAVKKTMPVNSSMGRAKPSTALW